MIQFGFRVLFCVALRYISVCFVSSQETCSGTQGKVVYTFETFSSLATFTITEDATQWPVLSVTAPVQGEGNTIEYPFCATGTHHTLTTTSGFNYLPKGSYLTVKLALSGGAYETVVRLTHNRDFLGFPNEHYFNTEYLIPAGATTGWYSKSDTIPSDWAGELPTSGWEAGKVSSTKKIQLFKYEMPGRAAVYNTGFVLSVKYRYGCIIKLEAMNTVYELFRDGVDGDLTSASVATTEYSNWDYKHISLPSSLLPPFGTSVFTVTVALIGKTEDSEESSDFDLAFRYTGEATYNSRMFGYTLSSEGINDVANAFDLSHESVFSPSSCTNHIDIIFNENQKEWINSVDMQIGSEVKFPSSFVIKAETAADSWTVLRTVDDIVFTKPYERQTFYFPNTKAYKNYRLESIANDDCDWKLVHVDLSGSYYSLYSSFSYLYTDNNLIFEKGIFGKGSYKNTHFYDFSISPALPSGLSINKQTGVISGTATTAVAATSHTVTASRVDGQSVTATVSITVVGCETGSELMTAYLHTNVDGNYLSVYEGENTSGDPIGTTGNGYLHFCAPSGINTVKVTDNLGHQGGNYKNSMKKFYLAVGDFIFDYGAVEKGQVEYITKISSVLPFKSTTEWSVLKSGEAPSGWETVDFVTDSTWSESTTSEIGTGATTVYLRKEFTIPSLDTYRVLNVQVKYSGGVVAYFNGNKVARFNLPESFGFSTIATHPSTDVTTSTFSIILSATEATETKNVMAFEIHSVSSNIHTVTFSTVGVFGVNECSILTNSVSGPILNNYYSETYSRNYFDMNPYTNQNFENSVPSTLPTRLDAYVQWSVDNLEPVQYNAFGFLEVDSGFEGCEVEWKTPVDEVSGYVTIASALDQTFNSFSDHSYLVSDSPISGREFQINIPKMCRTKTTSVPFFAEVGLRYCAAQTCPADGDYPSVMNGQKSTIRCPAGYSGYKSRSCVNGVLETSVEDGCVPVNEITYDRKNLLVIVNDDDVSFTPTSLFEITTYSLTGTLPTGLTFNEATGTISGTATEVTDEMTFTVTGAHETYGASVTVTMIVVDEEVFAITKGAEVKEISGTSMTKMEVNSEKYDYYNLQYSVEYTIVKQEGAVVIPPEGSVWGYERPVGDIEYVTKDSSTYWNTMTITADDMFTHYIHTFTTCPEGKSYVSVHSSVSDFFAQYCVTPNVPLNITIERTNMIVRDIDGEIIPIAYYYNIHNNYVVPEQTSVSIHPELVELLNNPEYEGVVGYGPYKGWSNANYVQKLMMNAPYVGKPSIVDKPTLTFENGKKKTILNWRNALDSLEGDVQDYDSLESRNNYITETALTMMEIVYYMKNSKKIHLSRSQLTDLVATDCTEGDCAMNWSMVISALKNNGVCEEGEVGECDKYKMVGFSHPSGADRNTKWIKEQIDAGKPVFAILSVNPKLTQHHTANSMNPINKAAPGLMNYGGVVIGYNAERTGFEYWEIAVRRHGADNNMIKVKMDVNGKNFARITNYAFTIEDVSV